MTTTEPVGDERVPTLIDETFLRTCVFRVLLAGLVFAVLVGGEVSTLSIASGGGWRWHDLLAVPFSGLGLGLVVLGPSLVEVWARRRQASLARDAFAAALIFVTALAGMSLALVQLKYTWTFAATGSIERASQRVVSYVSHKVLGNPCYFLAYGSIPAAPFVAIVFRLRGVRLAWQMPLGVGASLLCASPGVWFTNGFRSGDVVRLGCFISAGGAFLPLACAGADYLEARFSRWLESRARGGA